MWNHWEITFFVYTWGITSFLPWSADYRAILQGIHWPIQRWQNAKSGVSGEWSIFAPGHYCWKLLCLIQKKVLPSHWKDLSMSTVRNRIIHHGSSMEIIDGVIKIRLNRSFPYQSEIRQALETLRQQVKIQQVVSDKKRFEPWSVLFGQYDNKEPCIHRALQKVQNAEKGFKPFHNQHLTLYAKSPLTMEEGCQCHTTI